MKKQIMREMAMVSNPSAYYTKRIKDNVYVIELLAIDEDCSAIGIYRVYTGHVPLSTLYKDKEYTAKLNRSLGLLFEISKPKVNDFKIFGLPYILRSLREQTSSFLAGYELHQPINESVNNIGSTLVANKWRKV